MSPLSDPEALGEHLGTLGDTAAFNFMCSEISSQLSGIVVTLRPMEERSTLPRWTGGDITLGNVPRDHKFTIGGAFVLHMRISKP